jgi:hypothetical protein
MEAAGLNEPPARDLPVARLADRARRRPARRFAGFDDRVGRRCPVRHRHVRYLAPSAALGWWRLAALCLASLAVTIVAVIVAHELWERAPDPRVCAQVLLFNVTTVLTVTIGIASLYAALFLIVLAADC